MPPILSLLTDFGHHDWYVAAVKGVVLSRAPGTTIVDIAHDVPPGDVETASFLLSAAARSFPPGTVHLAIVDPGVGSQRRMLAVEAPGAEGASYFLAPDNGLLDPFLAGAGIVSIDRPDLYLANPGNTFHGRDRFAPAAAFLLAGGGFDRLGPQIDDPVRLEIPPPLCTATRLSGRVAHVDRYGNLVTDLPSGWLPQQGNAFQVSFFGGDGGAGNSESATRKVGCYAELEPGEPGLLMGSLGTIELSLRGASLAEKWGLQRGHRIEIELELK
ncbi:MAG TPA: SAM-dependent chlorinase/fluorinase [Thermoanaerobaculia bacterium]|jgi:S-adenosylmethionine hydrolase|nr:SAM-dependent chlorinase/fluorinase [Thermoanaerobaculia bacterium]